MNGAEPGQDRQNVRWLKDHWSRPIGPYGYYWFLTFENSPDLRSLTRECQKALNFPFYDLSPPESLHLTLERIFYNGEGTPERVDTIETYAKHACQGVSPFTLTVSRLSSVPSAVAFYVSPAQRVHNLRNALRSATLAAHPDARVKESASHPPHITIAYANSDGASATDAMAAVERVNQTMRRIEIEVTEAVMVLLERQQKHYSWKVISRIPLSGV